MLKYTKKKKNLPMAQMMPEALLGPVFIALPSPASSFIDYVTVLLLPMVVCWNWPLPVVVEGEE